MQAWARLWQKMGILWGRQAWGLAPDGQDWALVALSRDGADLWRVDTSLSLKPPEGLLVSDASWLSEALAHVLQLKRRPKHRVSMGLPAHNLATGQMVCPAALPEEAWPAEVQLEVAQALNLPPEAVNFDFVSQPLGVGAVHHIHWVGCARALILDYKHWIGAAKSWRLTAVEPELHAARRAACPVCCSKRRKTGSFARAPTATGMVGTKKVWSMRNGSLCSGMPWHPPQGPGWWRLVWP